MAEKITGNFPGGPTRRDTRSQRAGPVRTRSVERIEEARAARMVQHQQRARRKRIAWGFLAALILAGGAGLALGLESHSTAAGLSAAAEASRVKDLDISQEVNRTLLELWRMEDVEAQRGRGLVR